VARYNQRPKRASLDASAKERRAVHVCNREGVPDYDDSGCAMNGGCSPPPELAEDTTVVLLVGFRWNDGEVQGAALLCVRSLLQPHPRIARSTFGHLKMQGSMKFK